MCPTVQKGFVVLGKCCGLRLFPQPHTSREDLDLSVRSAFGGGLGEEQENKDHFIYDRKRNQQGGKNPKAQQEGRVFK